MASNRETTPITFAAKKSKVENSNTRVQEMTHLKLQKASEKQAERIRDLLLVRAESLKGLKSDGPTTFKSLDKDVDFAEIWWRWYPYNQNKRVCLAAVFIAHLSHTYTIYYYILYIYTHFSSLYSILYRYTLIYIYIIYTVCI